MDEKEYLDSRLNDQLSWYSKKSKCNQKWHKILRVIEIVCAAIIPFIAGMGSVFPLYQIVVGGLGVIIAISAGLSSLYKFQENWIEYRTTAETLKHEKYLYQTKCSPYDDEDAFHKLVQRVEGLISKENTQWLTHVAKKK